MNRVLAVNHAGWEIQIFVDGAGWTSSAPITSIFHTRPEAVTEWNRLRTLFPNREWRVYEKLKGA